MKKEVPNNYSEWKVEHIMLASKAHYDWRGRCLLTNSVWFGIIVYLLTQNILPAIGGFFAALMLLVVLVPDDFKIV